MLFNGRFRIFHPMPTLNQKLRPIFLKVERAKKHIVDLVQEVRHFMDTNPYKVETKRNPETRKLIYYVADVAPVPDSLALIVGDVIQNLRTALYHLAYQLVCKDTEGNPPDPKSIYFPIAVDVRKYNATKKRKMKGAGQETFDEIDKIKPYKGGNDLLWVLHQLNNIDKHRLLLMVGSKASGMNIGQYMVHTTKDKIPDWASPAMKAIESMGYFHGFADGGFPLQPGHHLSIGQVDEVPNPKQEFKFDVALHELGVSECGPLIETIKQLLAAVENTITALAPRLG